jgi:hypothetical protein
VLVQVAALLELLELLAVTALGGLASAGAAVAMRPRASSVREREERKEGVFMEGSSLTGRGTR